MSENTVVGTISGYAFARHGPHLLERGRPAHSRPHHGKEGSS